jgi:O-antigen ligase
VGRVADRGLERRDICFLTILVFLWLALLGVQLEISSLPFRLALSDFVIGTYVIFLLWRKKIFFLMRYRGFLVLGVLFTFSLLWSYKNFGYLGQYALYNKYIGLVVLVVSALFVSDWVSQKGKEGFQLCILWFSCTTGLINCFYLLAYLPPLTFLRDVFVFLPSTEARLRGLLVDPNAYGGLLMVALLLLLPALEDTTLGKWKRIVWISFFSLTVGLFLTTSRSAYLGFISGILFFALLHRGALRRFLFFALPAGGFILGVLLSPLREPVLARIVSLKQIVSRMDIMEAGIRAFVSSPLFGLGLGSFFELSQTRFGLPWKQIIHNSYLWILADMGIVGLGIWTYLLFRLWQKGWRIFVLARQNNTPESLYVLAVLASLAGMLTFALGVEALYQRYLWMLIGLIIGLGKVKDLDVERDPFRDDEPSHSLSRHRG